MRSRNLLHSILFASLAVLFLSGETTWAESSHARVIRLSLVQGQVRFTRDFHQDSLADQKAVWEDAVLNLPIRQAYAVATDNGRAEVEFENGAMAYLAENSVLEFYDLSLQDGAKTTRLILRQGTASFYVNPANGDFFSVTGGDFSVEASGRANFRLDNFDDGSVVNVSKGHVSVLRKDKTTLVAKGQSLSIRANDDSSVTVGRAADEDNFDHWVSGREDAVVTATNAGQQYVNSPYYTSGIADLYAYGSWYSVSGYGNCWRPYGAGFGWSPFSNGGWYSDPSFGWMFIGSQPWGWLPYHYGGWIFDPGFGWVWSPFGLGFSGFGGGFIPFRPVTGVFVRSRTGLLGLVPTHPLDAHGKAPINLTKGVFEVTGGAVSQHVAAAEAGDHWKTVKSAPRTALATSVSAAAAPPARVSRTIVAASAGSRATVGERNSSIVYDPHERRFVNTNSAPAASANTRGATAQTQMPQTQNQGSTDRGVDRGGVPNMPRGNAAAVREGNAPAAPRASAPPPRAMTPPPAPHASAGGNSRSGSSWGGGAGSSPAGSRSSAPASAPAPHASAPSGRPH